ncbi:MAG: hypothetical protein L0H93_15535, partial [Nocardioides sp.]|nr:hypothetical protein [Nocardioides sp.]
GKWVSAIDYSLVMDDTAAGEAARREIGDTLVESLHGEWPSQGVGLGYRYDTSPLFVADGTPPTPDEVSTYVPTARPGHRAPHVYLADGRSTIDLFGGGFVLLRLAAGDLDVSPMLTAAAERGLPIRLIDLDDPSVRATYGAPLVLVRPDGHVAWRANEVSVDPGSLLDIVRGAAPSTRMEHS